MKAPCPLSISYLFSMPPHTLTLQFSFGPNEQDGLVVYGTLIVSQPAHLYWHR